MRILLLNYEYPPLGGGAGNAAQYLVREFQSYPSLTIDVVTSSTHTFSVEHYSDRITIHRLNIYKHGKNLYHQSLVNILLFTWKSYWYIHSLRRQHRYDGIHAFFGMPCGLIAAAHRLPFIVSLRGSDVPFYNPRFYLLDTLFGRFFSRLVWRRAVAVTPNSYHLRDLAQRVVPHQHMMVVPNGVDINTFCLQETLHHPITVLCVARLVKRKCIRSVIEAAALLSEERNDFKILIVGDGEEKERLGCLIKKLHLTTIVTLAGSIPHERTIEYYTQADIFILPSLNEGMSNSLLEALASGLVLMSTPTGDASHIINDSNGVIVPFLDSQSIAEHLNQFLNAPDRLVLMKRSSRAQSLSMTWGSVAQLFLSLYKQSFIARV